MNWFAKYNHKFGVVLSPEFIIHFMDGFEDEIGTDRTSPTA